MAAKKKSEEKLVVFYHPRLGTKMQGTAELKAKVGGLDSKPETELDKAAAK